MMHLANGDMEK